jgi:hypothetical protein
MRLLGAKKWPFPVTPEEAVNWKPSTLGVRLDKQIVAAATTRIEGAWVAKIGVALGANLTEQTRHVLANGTRLDEPVARALFEAFDGIIYSGSERRRR